MSTRFKSRKRKKKNKKIIYILILLLIIYIMPTMKNIKLNSNVNLINNFLKSLNITHTLPRNKIYKMIKKNIYDNFNKPEYILSTELGFKKNIKNVEYDKAVFTYSENDLPLIYIYNSHQGEQYSNKLLEDYNISPTVYTASHMLKEKLDNIGINTLVEENDIQAYMKEKNYNHSKSYIASRKFLTDIMKKYNSIKLYIDLHRDSVDKEYTTVTINNKQYAKVMFVIGLKNNAYQLNYNLSENLNNKLKDKYPGISRGILKKGNVGANGIYNQDLNPNIILIEVGGYQNNIDEINNTLDALSNIIGEYINEKE